jgi:hypothetical protein
MGIHDCSFIESAVEFTKGAMDSRQSSPAPIPSPFSGDPLMEQDLEIVKAPVAQRYQLTAKAEIDTSSGLPLFRFEPTLNVTNT